MSSPIQDLSEGSKHVIDAASLGWLATVILANLPAVTAGLSAVWVLMRMYQSWQEIRLNSLKLNREEGE